MTNADIDKTYDEGFTHETYGYVGSKEFVDKMSWYIEAGSIRAENHDYDMSSWEIFTSYFFIGDGASNLLAASAVALTTLALAF